MTSNWRAKRDARWRHFTLCGQLRLCEVVLANVKHSRTATEEAKRTANLAHGQVSLLLQQMSSRKDLP